MCLNIRSFYPYYLGYPYIIIDYWGGNSSSLESVAANSEHVTFIKVSVNRNCESASKTLSVFFNMSARAPIAFVSASIPPQPSGLTKVTALPLCKPDLKYKKQYTMWSKKCNLKELCFKTCWAYSMLYRRCFFQPKLAGLILGCTDAAFSNQILIGKRLTRSTIFTYFSTYLNAKKTRSFFNIRI